MHAHHTAGVTAAAARVAVPTIAPSAQLGLGYAWQTVAVPCESSVSNGFALDMAMTTNKRRPRRLGQRTT